MAIEADILKKIRRIHIKSQFLSTQLFTGEYESAFKGSGIAFEEVREYVPGDEVRAIDWNVTARIGRPHIKIFREERERQLVILLDRSASMHFGGPVESKHALAVEVAAVLAYAAVKSHDKVGLISVTDRVESFIPPKKGRAHVWRLIRDMLTFTPEHRGSSLESAVARTMQAIKRRAICVVISDFLDPNAAKPLQVLSKRHEVVALSIEDPLETHWPRLGLLPVYDLESGAHRWIDTRGDKTRIGLEIRAAQDETLERLRRLGIATSRIAVGSDYIHALIALFHKRETRRV